MSRLLSGIDEELFLFVFIEWIGEIARTRGTHLAVDGKALRAAAEKCKGKRAPMLLHVMDAATGLVLGQLPIALKENEITNIPKLLSYLDITGSVVTADALNTQTSIMEYIISRGGHFLMMVKRNQPGSYDEIIKEFEGIKADRERVEKEPGYHTMYPEIKDKYDEASTMEKNHGRHEYRECRSLNDASILSKSRDEWPFLKSVGYSEQVRILAVRDEEGNDVTPSKERFLREGSPRQPHRKKATRRNQTSRWWGSFQTRK